MSTWLTRVAHSYGRARRTWWAAYALATAVVGTLLYAPILRTWFVGDDLEEIWGGHLGGPQATQNVHAGRNFRPVNLWFHDVTYRWFGWDPLAFHVVLVIGHVANAVVLAVLVERLIQVFHDDDPPSDAAWAFLPFVTGALFLVAPNHTEAVSWISARGDVLSTLLVLTSVWCWLRRDRGARWAVLASVAYGIAVLCKESVVLFPVVVSLLEVALDAGHADGRDRRRRVWSSVSRPWSFYLVVAVYFVARRLALGTVQSSSFVEEFVGESVGLLLKRTAALVVRAFVPGMGPVWWSIGGVIVVAVLAGSAARAVARKGLVGIAVGPTPTTRLVAFAVASMLVLIAPVGHLGASATGLGGERLVYLPSVFAAILVALLISSAIHRSVVRLGVLVVVLLLAGSALVSINRRWDAAGSLAESMSEQMSALPVDRRAYLLNTPDSLGGAYVLRNAAEMTLVTQHGWQNPPPIVQLSSFRLVAPSDRVVVERTDRANTWVLRLTATGASFVDVAEGDDHTGVVVRRRSRGSFEFTLAADVDLHDVWYVSGGRLRSLADLESSGR